MNFLAKLIFGGSRYTDKMTGISHDWDEIDRKYGKLYCPVCGDKNAKDADFCSVLCSYYHYSEKGTEGG